MSYGQMKQKCKNVTLRESVPDGVLLLFMKVTFMHSWVFTEYLIKICQENQMGQIIFLNTVYVYCYIIIL